MDVSWQLRCSKGLKHCQNASQTSYKVNKVVKVKVLLQSSLNADNVKIDVWKMKIGFWVEQCVNALFECTEDVNEITKYHTKSVSCEFCMISLFL